MKKLVVMSETPEDEKAAAALITSEMIKNGTDAIVWYTDMGKKIAEMVALQGVMKKHGEWLDILMNRQGQFFKELSDLRHVVADQKKVIDTIQKFVDDQPVPPKEGPKKSKEKT